MAPARLIAVVKSFMFEGLFTILASLLVGVLLLRTLTRRRKGRGRFDRNWRDRRRLWTGGTASTSLPQQPYGPTDAADQLRVVMGADFAIQPLLNKPEVRLFRELERLVTATGTGWQVMAQVSLGEILTCRDREAYGCINAKRVDLLLMDQDCRPRHAVEYQGGGHHQGTAAARDAVKREALRRAGVGYHEIIAGETTPADLKRLVERLVERSAS